MRKYGLLAITCLFVLQATAQKRDNKLQQEVERLVAGFGGDIGVYMKNLKTGRVVAINADTVFPTASMVKIPIMVGVMDKLEKGELQYTQELTYKDSLLYEGVDILGSFKNGEKIELGKVMMLMLTMSDNTASLWLQSLAGTGTYINQLMEGLGLQKTRVNSRTAGREEARSAYGWGQTTPEEMARLLEKIVRGEVVSAERSRQMLRILGRNFWDDNAIMPIPPDVFVASKNGAVNGSRSEVLFVNGRGAQYIFSVCTKNNRDESWKDENEAWVLTRKLSKLVWEQWGGRK